MKSTASLAVLALLSACATSGPVTEMSQVCAGWQPILISQADQITEGTAAQIEAHNEYGAEVGCWQAP